MISKNPNRTKQILFELSIQTEEALFRNQDDERFNAFFATENNESTSEEESNNDEQTNFYNFEPDSVDPEDF